MKKTLFLLLFSSASLANTYEVCVPEGYCAIGVYSRSGTVFLVKEDSLPLNDQWDAPFALVTDEEYASIPIDETFEVTMRAKGTGQGGGTPPPSLTGGGPLIGGDISITIGSDPCAACHKGSMREIHKKLLEKKQ